MLRGQWFMAYHWSSASGPFMRDWLMPMISAFGLGFFYGKLTSDSQNAQTPSVVAPVRPVELESIVHPYLRKTSLGNMLSFLFGRSVTTAVPPNIYVTVAYFLVFCL